MKNDSYRPRTGLWIVVTLRALFLLALFLLLGASFYFAQDSLSRDPSFKLSEVRYQGAKHLDRAALNRLIEKTFPDNLLAIDLARIRNLVEGEAWVREAVVRRKLPHTLILYVKEREPRAVAAIDNELYVVDETGVVLDLYGSQYQALDNPIVKGLRNVAQENAAALNSRRMVLYLEVLRQLQAGSSDYSRSVSEIDVGNPEQVGIVPAEEPVQVFLGDREFLKRYLLFLSQMELYRKLKEQYGTIEYVDVTYDSKVIFHTPQNTTPAVSASEKGNSS